MSQEKNRKLFLHIGLHKTGTTSIQKSLAGYKDDQTIYADLGDPNHTIFMQTLFGDNNFYQYWQDRGFSINQHSELIKSNRLILEKQIHKNFQNLIISGEGISTLNKDNLLNLKSYFSGFNFTFKVLIFVRNPIDWTVSCIQENIKHRIISLKAYQIYTRIENMIAVFGKDNVEIHRYEDSFVEPYRGDIVKYFSNVLNLKKSTKNKQFFHNSSINEISFKLSYNFLQSPIFTAKSNFLHRIRSNFIYELENIFKGSQPINKKFFHEFVDWNDYKKVNQFLDQPYELEEANKNDIESQSFSKYINDIDTVYVRDKLYRFLVENDYGPSDEGTINDLLMQVYCHSIRKSGITFANDIHKKKQIFIEI